jgi:predicted ATPase/DNA-binding SARP family transcriptional activator
MLGPLEVRDGAGSPRAVSGTRLRALLVLLALRAGEVVAVSSLIGELWGEQLPADAPNALQALVSRLRRAIGEPAAVVSGPAGYRLRIDRDDVDVFRFERLAACGRAALAASPDEAASLLTQALALWRGEPLPDAAETETGRAAIARLTELRLAAVEGRIGAELRLGGLGQGGLGRAERVPRLVAELEGLLAASPTRETLAALLMRALAADGRRGTALRVYERTRERLADELGADPSPELAALHLALLRTGGPPAAPPPTSPQPTSPPPAVPPSGTPPASAASRPDRLSGAPGNNLPTALTSFIGRESDLGGVGALLREHRLVTLTGPGGAGKTRLAIEAARASLSDIPRAGEAASGPPVAGAAPTAARPDGVAPLTAFPGGAWLAELAPVTDPEDVAATVLSAFGLREQALLVTRQMRAVDHNPGTGEDALDRLIGALANRQALLVLDNCEHLIGAAADLADRVLARCPGMRVLATSREPLNITGEALWPVGPLAEPPAERLFTERAAAVCPGFRLTAENSPAVSRICRALDGMPLAIELAAARTRTMTPAQIADRLDRRFRLLTSGSRTALPRHQTLRAVVDWSWDLLDDTERALLRRLSVFAGGATLEAAEEVCAGLIGTGPPVARDDVLDLLTALADKSLVTVRQTLDGPRYRLLETIREYGRDRLAEADETEPLRRRHAAHFLSFAERAQPHLFGAQQLDWLRRMSADADNVHLAIRAAVAAGDSDAAIGLVGGFGWYWWLRSLKKEGGDLAALALRDAPTAAQAIGFAGDSAGLERLTAAYGIAGMLAMDSPRTAESVAWLREAEELARRLSPRPGAALVPYAVLVLAGPLRVLVESHGRELPDSLDDAVADPHPFVSGLARVMRGQIALNHGRLVDQAEADFRAAVGWFQEVGERWGLAMAVSGLAQIEVWRGELAAAAAHFERAAELAGQLGTTEDETQFRLFLARVLWDLGGTARDRARAEVARALRDADRLGWPEVTSYAAYVAGDLARLDGDFATARERLGLAVGMEGHLGVFGQVTAVAMTSLGYLAAADGDLGAARSWHARALAAALPSGDSPVIAGTLTGLADMALRDGDAARAATLLGAAEGVRGTRDRSDEDGGRVAAAARALLGAADYSAALQRGQEVTLATLEAALAGFLTPGA